jgi:endonuclease/exonuclease/phosphatase (EEP) superfamily protein YafD
MKIVSWNLLHGAGATLDQVTQLIERERPDLLIMQETTAMIDRLTRQMGGYYARNPLPGRAHGLAAWSASPFREPPLALTLQAGLFVKRICQVIVLDRMTIANVHLSHGQVMNRRQLRRIAGHLPDRAAIIGDCNMVGPPLLPGFRDVGPRQPTHAMADMLPLRLDRCFARGLTCTEAAVLDRTGSDHHPITMRLAPPS